MYSIAVAGCGSMAKAWIQIAQQRQDCRIAALIDVDTQAAEQKKAEFSLNASVYSNLKTALGREEIDIVFDITPPQYHYQTVTTALEAGCHVFGEKPMSDSLAEAYRMVECAQKSGKEYFVMQNRRYQPYLYAMRDFVQNGNLGAVGQISADFRLNPHFGGFRDEMGSPLIADMAIHTFDAARFLLGKNPVSVYCHEFNPSWSWYHGDANAVCIFEMEDGSVFDYRGSWCANGLHTSWESEWRISCRDGGIFWDGGQKLYYELDDKRKKDGISPVEGEKSPFVTISPCQIAAPGHEGCINEMFEALTKGVRPQTDCRDNIKSIEMVHKALQSSREKKSVKF